jgi:Tol biopolymer transport system component
MEGEGWGNFKILPFCDEAFSFGHPAISPDGKTLYFVSSLTGSKGVTDIYKVSILGNNNYGEPERLSNNVNSNAKELFPYVSFDGYLYYSAKKRDGMGRLDVYKSKILEDGTYGPSEILEAPINSKYDDYGFIINVDSKSGYFTSNRRGGKGGADVYYFETE